MKKLHVLLLLCITALCNLELKAQNPTPADFEYDGLWYRIVSIEDRTVEFTWSPSSFDAQGYNNFQENYSGRTNFIIPETVSFADIEWKVIGINEPFWSGNFIENISFPKTIKYIDGLCGESVTFTEDFVFPDSLEWIHNSIFHMSTIPNNKIVLPKSLKKCGVISNDYSIIPELDPITAKPIKDQWGNPIQHRRHLNTEGDIFMACNLADCIVIINDGLERIPNRMFGLSSVKNVILPSTLKTIDPYGLESAQFKEFILPENVDSLYEEAFYNCNKLERLTLYRPIYMEKAFQTCTNLRTVILLTADAPAFQSDNFANATYVAGTLWVPEGTKKHYQKVAGWKNFLNIKEGLPEDMKFELIAQDNHNGSFDFIGKSDESSENLTIMNSGETVTVEFDTKEGFTVESVTLDGEDITSQLVKPEDNNCVARRAPSIGKYSINISNVGRKTNAHLFVNWAESNTGIRDMKISENHKNENIYTLDGRTIKSSTIQKGIYIVGGRKVVVK